MRIIENIDDEIKNSINIHEMVLDKVLNNNYIFIIGDKKSLLDFIDEGRLSAEPLQINGENMLSPTREGEFHYTYFIKKDENLKEYIEYITKGNEYVDKVDINKLVGISFQTLKNGMFGMNFLSVKEKEYNIKNVEERVNMTFPIPTEKDIREFDRVMADILSNPEKTMEAYKRLFDIYKDDIEESKKGYTKTKTITYYIKGPEDLDRYFEVESIMRMNNIEIMDTGMFISNFPRKRNIQVPAIQANDVIKILTDEDFEIVSIEDDTDIE